MATFTLTINTDNAASHGEVEQPTTPAVNTALGEELAAILANVKYSVRNGQYDGPVRDSNGNTVGKFELTENN